MDEKCENENEEFLWRKKKRRRNRKGTCVLIIVPKSVFKL